MPNRDPHPLAGQTVTLPDSVTPAERIQPGAALLVEDWWDRVTGASWMDSNMPAAYLYSIRSAGVLPLDDDVVYGHIAGFGYLLHESELPRTAEAAEETP